MAEPNNSNNANEQRSVRDVEANQRPEAAATASSSSSGDRRPAESIRVHGVVVGNSNNHTASSYNNNIDFEEEDDDNDHEEEVAEATWQEVYESCCCHTPAEWAWIWLAIFCVCVFLYFFLFSLELMGMGAKVMTGCKAGELFTDETNPVAGVMVGILATVLMQSSSTTTSIIVNLVGSTISMSTGVYMIMGANIGTTITNTIVAMGMAGDPDQLERAFAGATVHDMFNFMTVAILFPLELITGYLEKLTGAMVKNASVKEGEEWEGPVRALVSPLGHRLIIANKKAITSIATGESSCSDFYPMDCGDGEPTYNSCGGKFGLIACDEDTGRCPSFFYADATDSDDKLSGGVVFFLAIMMLFTCLLGIITVLQKLLLGMSTRIITKATTMNGYLSIAFGCGITLIIQSSSIFTSVLTPLAGIGVLTLEQMFALTLGANLGTTLTSVMASMVADTIDALQVALCHVFFNVTGVLIFYPIPFMRKIPLFAARRLGKATRLWRGFAGLYIVTMFFLVPLFFLGISALFVQDEKGFKVLGAFLCVLFLVFFLYTLYWCRYHDGRRKCADCMIQRERKIRIMKSLPEDMEYLKARVAALSEHTGYESEEEDEDEDLNGKDTEDEVDA